MPFTPHIDFGPDKMGTAATAKNETKTPFTPMWVGALMYGPLVMTATDMESWDDASVSMASDLSDIEPLGAREGKGYEANVYALRFHGKEFLPDYYTDHNTTHYLRLDIQGDPSAEHKQTIQAAIQAAEAYPSEHYTEGSYAALAEQIGQSRNLLTQQVVTKEQADNCVKAIEAAIGALEATVTDATPLTEALAEAAQILDTLPAEQQVLYLQWKLIDRAASFLSDDIVEQNFDFYSRTMSGAQEMQPRWKRAVSVTSSVLGEAVGQMYVEKYFPAAAKERMVGLVKNLQDALGERIKALEWMSDETKAKALEKLAAFHVKIGYPDKWKDYSKLEIKNDSYYANIERATVWASDENMAKAGKPVDKEEWHMTPQTVNAYYNPTTNEICFPAGILQPPFFDMNADDAFNYGAIGVVIGHEMTHGFDDQGRQYDKEGNLTDWWTAEDAERFNERAQVMVNFFDSIQVAPGVHANGKQTLGENIADYGGLQVSYQAFKKATVQNPLPVVDGLTPEQRFFLAYAGVWANNVRPEFVLYLTKMDVHSLGEWRVNGALPQIDAWYEAFDITENDPMFLPKAERVAIW